MTQKRYLKLLREKRAEVRALDNELSTKRKRLNLEIDMLLEILRESDELLTDEELNELNSETKGDL